MGLGDVADGLIGRVERMGSMFETGLRLGVTGLSGAGKTVFITAFVAALLDRGRMRVLRAEAEGRIRAVQLGPQPDREVPRFAFETHLAALRGGRWPASTRSVSQLRLSIRYRPAGFLSGLLGERTLHLDIVDYPGEWLLDLPLMETDYDTWAAAALAAAEAPARAPHAAEWREALAAADPAAPHDEAAAARLAEAYAGYLRACKAAGLSALAPGRFLLPGDMEGSPALSFAPLPPARGRRTLRAEMAGRFEDYKRLVVKPFFRTHFARLDRQVVLIDALGAMAAGPRATSDLIGAMGETLACFRHGDAGWLGRLMGARRIGRLLFVASKADHLHHEQHPRLIALVEGMVAEAARRAAFAGAETGALAIASVRATSEQEIERAGRRIPLVRGATPEGGEAALYPGRLPHDLAELMAASGDGAEWLGPGFARVAFAAPKWPEGAPPHIRLDRVAEFLIGDELE